MFEVRSLDQMAASLPVPPTIINDLPAHTEEDRQRIRDLAVTTYDKTDKLTAVPQCHCGRTRYAHNIDLTCDHCGHPVEHFSSRTIKPDLWFKAPAGVIGLINPLVYNHIGSFIKSGRFRGLDWMIRDTIRTPDLRGRTGSIINRFNQLGIARGLNSFIENFEEIFEKVILKEAPRKSRAELQRYVDMYRDKFFVEMLPMPSKVMFIVEETSVGNYYNDIMNSCLDAIYTATSITSAFSERRIMNASALVCMQMAKFYDTTFSKFISGKGAWLRSAVYGNRSLFCFRNIITSDHDIHRYDEIKVPYKLLLNCLKTPVMHKLIYEHDFTYRQAHNYITRHARRTDPFLKTILEELIAATPNGRGIGCIFVRYPSLKRSSYMHVYITGVTETETRISVLNLVGPNALIKAPPPERDECALCELLIRF